ncbi:putative fungal specific transcription factor domain-containing protein [Colletotrichum sublineola]|uniref:Putative fungal specific transcription factor domain-containing protein n=1 Tax=Colletotrichum sublineola TaxID=1173701 RepID=A0A066X023_COLSU|nr:putative fungal specific transcription factor domain-containing protein [Colletotrichum sublineola]
MNAVLSHSIRWGRSDPRTKEKLDELYDGGALFGKHARSMVFEELSQGVCSIPTVQTLLLLSAQECSVGNSAQAWTYSGLAFRIIDHLGICVDGQRYPGSVQLTDEDVEIRHRLFWSCYFWDKMISLYLGRSPSLQQTSVSPPQIMFDDSSENESWTPFGVVPEGGWKYPPAAAHSTSCFMQMCRLSIVFNEILVHMYDPVRPNSQAEMQDCVAKQEVALRQWWEELPSFLKIEATALPALAPPSHIITLNVLYRTFKILLYRPMLSQRSQSSAENLQPVQRYLGECVRSATGIIAIFDLFCRSFGTTHCVLSLSYSVYIAASIFLLQVQSSVEDVQALRRLEYCVCILASVKRINPVISSALNLITRELVRLGIDISALGLPKMAATPPMATYGIPQLRPADAPPTSAPLGPEATSSPEQLYNFPFVDTLGPEAFAMDPQVFQTMSSIEPLSVRNADVVACLSRIEQARQLTMQRECYAVRHWEATPSVSQRLRKLPSCGPASATSLSGRQHAIRASTRYIPVLMLSNGIDHISRRRLHQRTLLIPSPRLVGCQPRRGEAVDPTQDKRALDTPVERGPSLVDPLPERRKPRQEYGAVCVLLAQHRRPIREDEENVASWIISLWVASLGVKMASPRFRAYRASGGSFSKAESSGAGLCGLGCQNG